MTGDARPRGEAPALRVPTSPQRDYFLDLAGALLDYIEEGGAVAYLLGVARRDGQRVVSFAVDEHRFREHELRRAARRRGPRWRWQPGRGLARR